MGMHEDMTLQKPPEPIQLPSGDIIPVPAALVRRTGLNNTDVKLLVDLRKAGHSWPEAKRELTRRVGTIDDDALEGWHQEVEVRVARAGRPLRVEELSRDVVLPSARNEAEQCTYRFPDTEVKVARCILRKHKTGGHVPGQPKYLGDSRAAPPAPGPAPSDEPLEQPQDEADLVVWPRARSPKSQCRYIRDDGARCVSIVHGTGAHAFDVTIRPGRKVRRRKGHRFPKARTEAAAAPLGTPAKPRGKRTIEE